MVCKAQQQYQRHSIGVPNSGIYFFRILPKHLCGHLTVSFDYSDRCMFKIRNCLILNINCNIRIGIRLREPDCLLQWGESGSTWPHLSDKPKAKMYGI
jgi:hypothetical protein